MLNLRIIAAAVSLSVGLSACANIDVTKLSDRELCRKATLGSLVGADTKSRAEMIARGLIEPREWDDIKAYTIKRGMSECAALATSYHRAWGSVRTVPGSEVGGEKKLMISAYDPRVLPASAQDYYNRRASEVVLNQGSGRPPITVQTHQPQRVQQLHVPKFVVTIRDQKVTECKAVDITKVGAGLTYNGMLSAMQNGQVDLNIFTLPCTQFVPGFRKY